MKSMKLILGPLGHLPRLSWVCLLLLCPGGYARVAGQSSPLGDWEKKARERARQSDSATAPAGWGFLRCAL